MEGIAAQPDLQPCTRHGRTIRLTRAGEDARALCPDSRARGHLGFLSRRISGSLYFAIHFQAFVFLALTIAVLAQYADHCRFSRCAGATTLWIVSYAVRAARCIDSWLAAGRIGIATLYGLLWTMTVSASRSGRRAPADGWRPQCRPVGTRSPAGSSRSTACVRRPEHLPVSLRSRTVRHGTCTSRPKRPRN